MDLEVRTFGPSSQSLSALPGNGCDSLLLLMPCISFLFDLLIIPAPDGILHVIKTVTCRQEMLMAQRKLLYTRSQSMNPVGLSSRSRFWMHSRKNAVRGILQIKRGGLFFLAEWVIGYSDLSIKEAKCFTTPK